MTHYEVVNFDGTPMTSGNLNDCLKWLLAEFPNATVTEVMKNFRIQPVSPR